MKKNNLLQSFVIASFVFFPGSMDRPVETTLDRWNGTVSFFQSETGPFIITSEWRIDGSFTNSNGPVTHTSAYRSKWDTDVTTRNCRGTNEGRVEVSINEMMKTYDIYVSGVPECIGSSTEQGENSTFNIPGGDSVIVIDRQPLGKNPALLTGTVTLKEGPYSRAKMRTITYKWNLVKKTD